MPTEAWLVLIVLALVFVALARGIAAPSAILLGGLAVLTVVGVVPLQRAVVGFTSSATIAIAGLFIVARSIRDHLGLERLITNLLEVDGRDLRTLLVRLLPPVALLSGVINNTPVVATTAPIVRAWSERNGVAETKLLIPLSFATILGGTLTAIGTSTNLVVSGALEAVGRPPLGFFTIGVVGAPMAIIGVGLIIALAPRLMPDRRHVEAHAVAQQRHHAAQLPAGSDQSRERTPDDDPTSAGLQRGVYRWLTLLTAIGMIFLAVSGLLPMANAVLVAVGVLLASGAVGFRRAFRALDIEVLLIVAAAIGLGVAVEASGLAGALGQEIGSLASGGGVLLGLALIVIGTLVLTELITNVAAAALVVPIAIDVADRVGGDPRGFAVAVALAASASFLTPIGYQTNTIVYGLGGHRFGDFWRLGLPLAVAVIVVSLVVVPLVWS